ncbi:MAG: type II toxin-antitoxin system RelE/ParE family toxin [Lachnospiraceae bacterium]|nr:type II toxin-antitoxin system RelE/ParE family toxin [Lachnospiraceae bacterium]
MHQLIFRCQENGEIWELRPLRNRILFAAWVNDSFVLLSHFMKKTQKTPKREIEKRSAYMRI